LSYKIFQMFELWIILPSYGTAGSSIISRLRGIYFVCSYAQQRHPPVFLFIYS
jgi:hypothetical protein